MELIRKAIIALTAEMLCAAPAHAQAPQAAPPTFGQPEPAPQTPRLLHPMFQDHAVVQRDRPIRVYGETTPGAVVTVTLGSTSVRASTGSNGHWSATLPAMPAGGPYTLTATANGESRTASDVLIGDVFLCAGQSNMALTQRAAAGAALDAQQATDGEIRQLSISNIARTAPISTFATSARWVVGSPQTVGDFSASCYYFVRELKKTVNVPMGMVVAAWGGARVRNWVSEEALRRLAYFNDELDMLALFRTDQQAAMRRWGTAWETWWKKVRPNGGEPWAEIFDDGSWEVGAVGAGKLGAVEW